MTNDDIQKLGEAARQIAEIVKKHRADGEAIRKALEPLRDVVEPRVVERVVERDPSAGYPQRRTGPMLGWPCEPWEVDQANEPPKPYGMPPRCGQPFTQRVD